MKVKELKQLLNKFSDNADIKICVNTINQYGNYRGQFKNITNIHKIIDQDTNKGLFVINIKV